MKLTIFLLLAGLLQVSAKSYAQKIDFQGDKVSISKVFAAIEKQTDVVFMYTAAMIRLSKPVSIKAENVDLNVFLQEIFKDQPIDYTIRDKSIFISIREKNSVVEAYSRSIIALQSLTFIVRDEEGHPLEGATLSKKGFNKMGITNKEGAVDFEVSVGELLEVSFVGYQSEVIKITSEMLLSKNYVIHLKKSQSKLDEVQITAYGKTTRRFATGSIGTVKAEDIERQPVMNILQALEGRVPGLNINQTSGNSAAPIKVSIRGRNSINPNTMTEPLYVIDGVPLGAIQVGALYGKNQSTGSVQAGRTNTFGESPLFFLNPRDVESVDVLKDADATAIYGARGANGVILITTKKAKVGPTSFNLSIDKGSITIPKKVDLMNTEEYLAMRKEAFRNDGIEPTISNAPDLMLWDQTKYTDWQEYFYKPGGNTTINGSVYGGEQQTNYRISANYNTREELNNNGGKNERASLMGNVGHVSLNQKFHLSFSSTISTSNVVAIPVSDYMLTAPNAPDVYTARGDFNFEPYRGDWGSNFPFSGLKQFSESKTNTVANNLTLSYEVVRGLVLSASGGYNFSSNKNATYTPFASLDPKYNTNMSSGAFYGNSNTNNWIIEPQIAYSAVAGKGQLSVQLGGSLQYVQNEGVTIIAAGFPDDNLMRSPNNVPFGMSMLMEGAGEYKYNAAFTIVNYRWDNKYVINLSGRRDGSSRFGPGKQFGDFGSVGLAWVASEEKWLKSVKPEWLSFLKFAGSYGITGSDGVSDYEYLSRWGTANTLEGFDKILDYNDMPGMHILAPINQNFRWEATKKLDASVNIGLFDDKISLDLNYYLNRSGNQLTKIGTPLYTGFENVTANWNAIVHNKGLELSMYSKIIHTKDWRVNASFNIGANKNKLVDFPELASSPYANTYKIGNSLNVLYLFHYIGIDPMTGDYVIEDHNKDGVISSIGGIVPYAPEDDRYVVKDMNPKYSGGLVLHVSYKDFDLNAGFSFVNQITRDPYFNYNLGSQVNTHVPQRIVERHWKQPGDIADYPRYTTKSLDYNFRNSDGAYTDGSYLKLASLAFSYNLPAAILQKIRMKGCRFYINTQNIFTITPFRGIDPQVQNFASPIPRTITSGLNLTF